MIPTGTQQSWDTCRQTSIGTHHKDKLAAGNALGVQGEDAIEGGVTSDVVDTRGEGHAGKSLASQVVGGGKLGHVQVGIAGIVASIGGSRGAQVDAASCLGRANKRVACSGRQYQVGWTSEFHSCSLMMSGYYAGGGEGKSPGREYQVE